MPENEQELNSTEERTLMEEEVTLENSEDTPLEEKSWDNLTDEEKHEIYIKKLKESKIKYRPIVHKGNVTINKFGAKKRQERKRKNRATKESRKANRK